MTETGNQVTLAGPNGESIDIEYSPKLIDRIRQEYGMGPDDEVTPTMVADYIRKELASALDKAEKEV